MWRCYTARLTNTIHSICTGAAALSRNRDQTRILQEDPHLSASRLWFVECGSFLRNKNLHFPHPVETHIMLNAGRFPEYPHHALSAIPIYIHFFVFFLQPQFQRTRRRMLLILHVDDDISRRCLLLRPPPHPLHHRRCPPPPLAHQKAEAATRTRPKCRRCRTPPRAPAALRPARRRVRCRRILKSMKNSSSLLLATTKKKWRRCRFHRLRRKGSSSIDHRNNKQPTTAKLL